MSKGGDVMINMLSDYKVNHITGEKFLRIAVRQWMTSYDPEIVAPTKAKRRQNAQPEPQLNGKEYEIHSLKFWKFDEELQAFQQEDEILYDISEQFLDLNSSCFNNDFFLTKNEHTYYFKKDVERHGFQLWKHSYGTPFHKWPVDNDPFPIHNNVIMKDYFIPAPKTKKLRDLQIVFLKDSSKDYSRRAD